MASSRERVHVFFIWLHVFIQSKYCNTLCAHLLTFTLTCKYSSRLWNILLNIQLIILLAKFMTLGSFQINDFVVDNKSDISLYLLNTKTSLGSPTYALLFAKTLRRLSLKMVCVLAEYIMDQVLRFHWVSYPTVLSTKQLTGIFRKEACRQLSAWLGMSACW